MAPTLNIFQVGYPHIFYLRNSFFTRFSFFFKLLFIIYFWHSYLQRIAFMSRCILILCNWFSNILQNSNLFITIFYYWYNDKWLQINSWRLLFSISLKLFNIASIFRHIYLVQYIVVLFLHIILQSLFSPVVRLYIAILIS